MRRACITMVAVCLTVAATWADPPAREAISNKLDRISIPEVDFRGANIHDVIDFFAEASKEFDRDTADGMPKGVNIILNLRVTSGRLREVPLLTFSARDVKLGEALRISCEVAGLAYEIENNRVLVADRYYLDACRKTAAPATALGKRLSRIIIAEMDLRDATISQAASFLNEKAEEADNGPQGVRLDLLGTDPGDWPLVSLQGPGLSLLQAVHMVAELCQIEYLLGERNVTLIPAKSGPAPVPVTTIGHVRQLTPETYPRVDNSTSAQPLQMLCACRILGADPVWQRGPIYTELRLAASALARAGLSSEEHRQRVRLADAINHHIPVSGTHGAYVNLIRGVADAVLVARAPSEDEISLAKAKGLGLDVEPVALDAFIFIANAENPVADLTTDAIRKIYSGKIRNWREVGGPAAELKALQRNRNSGSQELMEKLVMRGIRPIDGKAMMTLKGMGGPFNRISRDKWALGYSVFFYERRMATAEGVKLVAVDGVLPTSATIRDRSYPYVTEVYVATREDLPVGSPAAAFRKWLVSPEGQSVVAESGYVPIGLPRPREQ